MNKYSRYIIKTLVLAIIAFNVIVITDFPQFDVLKPTANPFLIEYVYTGFIIIVAVLFLISALLISMNKKFAFIFALIPSILMFFDDLESLITSFLFSMDTSIQADSNMTFFQLFLPGFLSLLPYMLPNLVLFVLLLIWRKQLKNRNAQKNAAT